jgi:two-component system cell cycle response regulator DivK
MADVPLVLIVDDNDRNRKLAGDVLRYAGFRTLEAATAVEAMALAADSLPDVILLDLRLPDLDGTVAARILRSDPRTSGVPIVALTALPVGDDDDLLTRAGFHGCIVKPIDIESFPDVVRRFCARRTD